MRQSALFDWRWRAPGKQFPEYLAKRCLRQHPNVRFVWNLSMDCWQIIVRDTDTGQWAHLRFMLEGTKPVRPTLANTLIFLNSVDAIHARSRAGFEAYMRKLDEEPEEKDDPNDVAMREEGSDRMWHAMGKRRTYKLHEN